MLPNVPRYVSPKERAENRARIIKAFYWIAFVVPTAIVLMMIGYSDQMPAWLREFTVRVDGAFGFPVLSLIKLIAA